MRVPVLFAAATLILVASATACSGGSKPAGTTTSPASTAAAQATVAQATAAAVGAAGTVHVCSLVSAAKASSIVGVS